MRIDRVDLRAVIEQNLYNLQISSSGGEMNGNLSVTIGDVLIGAGIQQHLHNGGPPRQDGVMQGVSPPQNGGRSRLRHFRCRRRTISASPAQAASCSGVLPSPSRAFTETPFFRSRITSSAFPVRTAECNASEAVGMAGGWAGDQRDAKQSTTKMAAPRVMPQRSTA